MRTSDTFLDDHDDALDNMMEPTVLFDTPMHYPNKRTKWSHLVASDLVTLHAFAERLGLKRSRFQNKTKKNKKQPHYDLPEHLAERARMLGAKQVTRKELYLFLESH